MNIQQLKSFVWIVILSGYSMMFSDRVEAQGATLTILGLQSVEGDDQFARSLTNALAHEAKSISEWRVQPQQVSLGQMKLLHGCDDLDAPCMNGIAFELDVRRLIYGVIRRTGVGVDYQFALTLNYFNAESGQLVRTVQDRIAKNTTSKKQLRTLAAKYLNELIGESGTGALKIITGVKGATILLDGELVESESRGGTLYLSNVPAGRKQVEIRVGDQPVFRGFLNVVESQETLFELPPVQRNSVVENTSDPKEQPSTTGQSQHAVTWPTYTSFGVSAAFLGLGVWSWVTIYQINSDPKLEQYRNNFPDQVSNICPNAKSDAKNLGPGESQRLAAHADRLCAQSDLHEILQWVFVGGAVTAAGLGTWFLIDDLSNDDSEDDFSLQIVPVFGSTTMGVTTRLQY